MAATVESQTLSVRIERDLSSAYAFLADPASFSRWASGLGNGLKPVGGAWVAETPDGPVEIGFTPPNAFGILDHRVRLASGQEIAVPMRVIANGGGCEVLFTLLRVPGMSDAQFAADAEWVRRDLQALKALLEDRPASEASSGSNEPVRFAPSLRAERSNPRSRAVTIGVGQE